MSRQHCPRQHLHRHYQHLLHQHQHLLRTQQTHRRIGQHDGPLRQPQRLGFRLPSLILGGLPYPLAALLCHLNNLAMLLGRKLKWDPKMEKFDGDDEANKLVTPKMRAPWKL